MAAAVARVQLLGNVYFVTVLPVLPPSYTIRLHSQCGLYELSELNNNKNGTLQPPPATWPAAAFL